jgi:hypothetical protein
MTDLDPSIRITPTEAGRRVVALTEEVERLRAELEDLRAGYQTVCDYAEQVDQLRAQRQAALDYIDQISDMHPPKWKWDTSRWNPDL